MWYIFSMFYSLLHFIIRKLAGLNLRRIGLPIIYFIKLLLRRSKSYLDEMKYHFTITFDKNLRIHTHLTNLPIFHTNFHHRFLPVINSSKQRYFIYCINFMTQPTINFTSQKIRYPRNISSPTYFPTINVDCLFRGNSNSQHPPTIN